VSKQGKACFDIKARSAKQLKGRLQLTELFLLVVYTLLSVVVLIICIISIACYSIDYLYSLLPLDDNILSLRFHSHSVTVLSSHSKSNGASLQKAIGHENRF